MTIWIESPFDSLPVEGYRKQRYWLMAEAFVAAGHEVVYWTSDFSHANKRSRELRESVSGLGFELVLLKTRPYAKNICIDRIRSHRAYAAEWKRQAMESIKKGAKKPDAIIVSLPPTSTCEVAVGLARRFGAKLIVDVQDAWPETFNRLLPLGLGWLGGILLWPMRRVVRKTYGAADLVTGVCDRYAEMVKSCGAKEYYRAYLGIEKVMAGRKDAEKSDRIRLAYVGNLGKSYDLKTVAEGVRKLNSNPDRRATLDVAGFGGEVIGDESVRFYGMLSSEELGRLLESCDIGVIPMASDSYVGIPNKLGEYAAGGLRVVSSLTGETESLINKYGCGATYVAGDAASFAVAVEKAFKLPASSALELCEKELVAHKIYSEYVRKVESLWN